jgi:hypothetical protein
MNYIDQIATDIQQRVGGHGEPLGLYRIYAVLALVKGPHTTNEDVHNAWAAWMAGQNPAHHSLILFEDLHPDVQQLDLPYTNAIQAVACEFWDEPA